ncbi:MAG: hypothetical protein J0M36_11220 [Caulobacterales bacterium]|nr:hypothetical protein [Caulobacterales bacterium]
MDVPVNGADFDADRGFEPTGPDILFSLPPMMLALLVLLGLALFALGWFLKDAQSPRRRDAADSIWKAVDDALKAAMKADGGSLVGKAEEIQRVIERRLGATVKIAGGLAPGLDALKRALDGRPPDAHAADAHDHDDHGNDDHGHGHGHDESHGSGHDEHGAASGHGAVTQITIVNGAASGAGEGGGGSHGPAPLTPRQRDHAIRAAVSDLNERWRDKTARIDEMRAAHRELSAD